MDEVFGQNTPKSRLTLFRKLAKTEQQLRGIKIQRLTIPQLEKLWTNQSDDVVVDGLRNINTIFDACTIALGGHEAVKSSVETIMNEHKNDKENGRPVGDGCIMLAWVANHLAHGVYEHELVGIMTMYRFKETEDFSTDATTLKDTHYNSLLPYFRGQVNETVNMGVPQDYFTNPPDSKYLYIDVLCSKTPGVGNMLLMQAIDFAILRKARGIVALSFSRQQLRQNVPASFALFQKFGFERLMHENAEFYKSNGQRISNMHGIWMALSLRKVSFNSFLPETVEICTHTGRNGVTVARCS